MSRTRLVATVLVALLISAVAAPAWAHTTANPGQAEAGGFAKIDFRVPHGCEGQPTEVLTVQIPEGVVSVKPEQVPGWEASTEIGPYDEPVELHGQEVTEGVKVATWTAQDGNELPDGQFREFGLSVRLPDRAGETLYFPAVQICSDGSEAAWIEIPEDGQDPHGLEAPAPSVALVASSEHGHGDSDSVETQHADDAAGTADEEAAAPSGDAGEATLAAAGAGGTDTLTIVALVVAVLGLAAGVGGIAVARRR